MPSITSCPHGLLREFRGSIGHGLPSSHACFLITVLLKAADQSAPLFHNEKLISQNKRVLHSDTSANRLKNIVLLL